ESSLFEKPVIPCQRGSPTCQRARLTLSQVAGIFLRFTGTWPPTRRKRYSTDGLLHTRTGRAGNHGEASRRVGRNPLFALRRRQRVAPRRSTGLHPGWIGTSVRGGSMSGLRPLL